jgi:hypothetical protein
MTSCIKPPNTCLKPAAVVLAHYSSQQMGSFIVIQRSIIGNKMDGSTIGRVELVQLLVNINSNISYVQSCL